MSFLYPNFLFLLSALSIPIIIHLFNFRRYKKIEFTNVAMLKDIEIASKSVKQLKNYLLLIFRILALAFLVFAFAQPFIPSSQHGSNKEGSAIALFIDNSFSMSSGSNGLNLIDLAKEGSKEIVNSSNSGLDFYLITNEFNQSDLNPLSKEEILSYIDKVETSIYSRSFSELNNRLLALLSSSSNNSLNAYLISDYQSSQFADLSLKQDTSINYNFVLLEQSSSNNVSIDSCWIESPFLSAYGIDSIYVRIGNYSEYPLDNHPIRLFVNERQVAIKSVNIDPWMSKTIAIPADEAGMGDFTCRFETVDNGIQEDDKLFFSFKIDSSISIYHIGGELNSNFATVFREPFNFNHDNEKNADVSLISKSDVFIINGASDLSPGLLGEIQKKVKKGSSLIIYPPDSSNLESMNQILSSFGLESFASFDTIKSEISDLNTNSPLFKKVISKMPDNPNYPWSKGHYKLHDRVKKQKEDVMSFANGDAALRHYKVEKGNVYVFSFGLKKSSSSFAQNALFVPIAINMAYSSQRPSNLYYYIGQNKGIGISDKSSTSNEAMHFIGNGLDVIPESRRSFDEEYILLHNQIELSGNYTLQKGNSPIDIVSLNFLRNESDLRRYDETTLQSIIKQGNLIKIGDSGDKSSGLSGSEILSNQPKALWKYCVILALIFFVAEAIIIKFMKT